MPIIANQYAKVKPSQPDCRPLITRDTIKILLPSCSFRCSAKLLVPRFKPLSRAHQQRTAPDTMQSVAQHKWRLQANSYNHTIFFTRFQQHPDNRVPIDSEMCRALHLTAPPKS